MYAYADGASGSEPALAINRTQHSVKMLVFQLDSVSEELA